MSFKLLENRSALSEDSDCIKSNELKFQGNRYIVCCQSHQEKASKEAEPTVTQGTLPGLEEFKLGVHFPGYKYRGCNLHMVGSTFYTAIQLRFFKEFRHRLTPFLYNDFSFFTSEWKSQFLLIGMLENILWRGSLLCMARAFDSCVSNPFQFNPELDTENLIFSLLFLDCNSLGIWPNHNHWTPLCPLQHLCHVYFLLYVLNYRK